MLQVKPTQCIHRFLSSLAPSPARQRQNSLRLNKSSSSYGCNPPSHKPRLPEGPLSPVNPVQNMLLASPKAPATNDISTRDLRGHNRRGTPPVLDHHYIPSSPGRESFAMILVIGALRRTADGISFAARRTFFIDTALAVHF